MSYEFVTLCTDNVTDFAPVHASAFSVEPWNEVWPIQAAEKRLSTFSQFPNFEGLGMKANGIPAAFVLGWAEPGINHSVFYVKEMCVASNVQRQGVGRTLLREFEERLRKSKFSGVYLQTRDDAPAMEFYDVVGFKIFAAASLGKRFQYENGDSNGNRT